MGRSSGVEERPLLLPLLRLEGEGDGHGEGGALRTPLLFTLLLLLEAARAE